MGSVLLKAAMVSIHRSLNSDNGRLKESKQHYTTNLISQQQPIDPETVTCLTIYWINDCNRSNNFCSPELYCFCHKIEIPY